MDTITHVTRELSKLHDFDPATQAKINWDIINVVNLLNDGGHLNPDQNTGRYIANVLTRVLALKPVTELTGQDDEWDFIHEECTPEITVMYNKRCPSIVKRINNNTKSAEVVDYGAVVISSDGGFSWWDREKCYANVEFPYLPPIVPSTLYVKQVEGDQYEVIDDEAQLAELRKAAAEEAEAKAKEEAEKAAANMPVEGGSEMPLPEGMNPMAMLAGMMGGMNGAIPPISPEQIPTEGVAEDVVTSDEVIDVEEKDCIVVTAEDEE